MFMLSAIQAVGSPFLYQHVVNCIFTYLKLQHSQETYTKDLPGSEVLAPLTELEQNALRFVCGYTCRKVRDKLKSYQEPVRENLSCALMELAGDEACQEGTEEWLNKVDRGGLWHVNDVKSGIGGENLKQALKDSINRHDTIKSKWAVLSSHMDETAATILFDEMVNLFITVRGFAFAAGCVEFFKQTHKKKPPKKDCSEKGTQLIKEITFKIRFLNYLLQQYNLILFNGLLFASATFS